MKDHFYDITLFIKFDALIEIFDLSLLAIFSDDFEILMNFWVKNNLKWKNSWKFNFVKSTPKCNQIVWKPFQIKLL